MPPGPPGAPLATPLPWWLWDILRYRKYSSKYWDGHKVRFYCIWWWLLQWRSTVLWETVGKIWEADWLHRTPNKNTVYIHMHYILHVGSKRLFEGKRNGKSLPSISSQVMHWNRENCTRNRLQHCDRLTDGLVVQGKHLRAFTSMACFPWSTL